MVRLNGNGLTLKTFLRVARDQERVTISPEQQERLQHANEYVQKVVQEERPVYGINTGFGKLSDVTINKCDTAQLQENLLKSHACGVGAVLDEDIVRGMMLLRVNALLRGHSGIRPIVIETLVEMLNHGVIPVVFEQGSLGASGDLAPLSHMSLPLIGLGECVYQGRRMPSKEAFVAAGIEHLSHLEAKEGLCLINGTQAMTSIGAMVTADAIQLLELANVSLSMTLEALEGILDAYDARVHDVRGQIGQIEIARQVREHLEGSTRITRQGERRVQDAYSLRCAPQVHGASWDAIQYVKDKIEIEMNAVTDNPILFPDDDIAISAGNFHGQPIALPMDFLAIAISELANIAERRIERLVNPQLSEGLPAFLLDDPGLNSGFMIVQYSAASLVSENKVLSHPASVDSIPSSANQEDHVSMGTIGARKARTILDNTRRVIAMEFLTAAQALEFRPSEPMGHRTRRAYDIVRKHVPFLRNDDVMYHHIHTVERLLVDGTLYQGIFEED
jgi:histidine ammonia-lyase